MRVGDGGACKLGDGEDKGGDEQTPESRHVQLLHQKVGANTYRRLVANSEQCRCRPTARKSTNEVSERQDRDMHNLALLNKLRACTVVVVLPKCLGLQQ